MTVETTRECLTALMPHDNGITSKDLFKEICSVPGYKIADPEELGKIIYSLRKNGFIETSEAATKSGRLHSITTKGIVALDWDKPGFVKPDPVWVDSETATDDINAAIDAYGSIDIDDKTTIEDAYTAITDEYALLRLAITSTQLYMANHSCGVVAQDIELKLTTLRKLSPMLSDDIKTVIDSIITDLEQTLGDRT